MKLRHIIVPALLLCATACGSFDRPTKLSTQRVEVLEGVEHLSFETRKLDTKTVEVLAYDYEAKGHGQVDITVTYDPKSKSNSAMNATNEAARIAETFLQNGVSSVEVNVLPVANSWNNSKTFLSYKSLTAQAPTNCGHMPGFKNIDEVGDVEAHMKYGYGCTIEAMLADQVAHPEDLLGRDDQTLTSEGRRAENVLWGRGYYTREAFPELGGERSSE